MISSNYSNLILFDGVCNFCNRWVNIILRFDKKGIFKFVPLQSDIAQQILKEHNYNFLNESVALIQNEKIFSHSTAALLIARQLQFPFFLLYGCIFIPVFLRDAVYNSIAKNRYRWFGKREVCRIPSEQERERFL